MRPSAVFLALIAAALASAKIVIDSASYDAGAVHIDIATYTDAPQNYDVVLVDAAGSRSTILSNVPTTSGVMTLDLPGDLPAGSYHVEFVSTSGDESFSSSPDFTVAAGDFGTRTSVTQASYTVSSSGTPIPFLSTVPVTIVTGSASGRTTDSVFTVFANATGSTSATPVVSTGVVTSESVFTTASVVSSGSVVTTVPVTASVPVNITVASTFTPTPTSALSSISTASAATAAIQSHSTTRSAGFKQASIAPLGISAFVVGLAALFML